MAITQQNRMMSATTTLGADYLLVNKVSAREAMSELFRLDIELLHEETDAGSQPTIVDISKILGQPMVVKIAQRDGTTRYFHGIVNNFSQGNRDDRFSYYYATVVPHVWLLTQKSQSRIFQHESVPDILKKVLAGFNVEWKLQATYEARNYCVQYRETDFDFAARLLEEEGIHFFFEHTEDNHKLIIADSPQQLDCPTKKEVPFFLEVTSDEDFVSSITTWRVDYKLQTGTVSYRDFHFELPKTKIDAEQPTIEEVAGNKELEVYDYPGGYARKYDGVDKSGGAQAGDVQKVHEDKRKTAQIRMQEIDAGYRTISGVSDCCSLTAGYRFKLFDHPNREFNQQYTLVSVTHRIEQSPSYVSEEEVADSYQNDFNCILFTTPFRPPLKTSKPIVHGSQTAFVVGPAGEEIFTDKYGRVKVQFHWDRDGAYDSNSSCWLRVAQSWAGKKWGMMFIPRIGMEVIVDFFEGDPDQPVITGCVYNAEAMPPYDLPNEKTKMTIKSDSSQGGQGFNEFRFEDKKGSEQIFIHGEKDIDIRIKNDEREYIGNDRHLVVKNDRREKIDRDTHLIVKRDQFEEIERDRNVKVKGDEKIEITGSQSIKVTGSAGEKVVGGKTVDVSSGLYLKGATVIVEGMSGLTLKVGGSFITINSGGVQISGPLVQINSGGSALAPNAVAPVAPKPPSIADSADNAQPGTKINLELRSQARKEKTHRESGAGNGANDKNKNSWIKIKLVDEAGKPVAGESYRIKTPDGSVASGTLNQQGEAHVKGIEPGNCQVTFPNLDKEAWEEG